MSLYWWGKALENYSQIKSDMFIRTSIESILMLVKDSKVVAGLEKKELEGLIDIVKKYTPAILNEEKEVILPILEADLKKR
jgi:hypothetical protein